MKTAEKTIKSEISLKFSVTKHRIWGTNDEKDEEESKKKNLCFSSANQIDSVRLSLKSRRRVIAVPHPLGVVDTDHRRLSRKNQIRKTHQLPITKTLICEKLRPSFKKFSELQYPKAEGLMFKLGFGKKKIF